MLRRTERFGNIAVSWNTKARLRSLGATREVASLDPDRVLVVGALEAGDAARRGLAAARGPEQDQELALLNLEIDVVARDHAPPRSSSGD